MSSMTTNRAREIFRQSVKEAEKEPEYNNKVKPDPCPRPYSYREQNNFDEKYDNTQGSIISNLRKIAAVEQDKKDAKEKAKQEKKKQRGGRVHLMEHAEMLPYYAVLGFSVILFICLVVELVAGTV